MSYDEETEYVTSYYRCIDPIENLRIRVVLKPVKSTLIPLPQFDGDKTSSEVSSQNDESQSDIEEYVFKWQEKVFSKTEIKHFGESKNKDTKLYEKYKDSMEMLRNSKNVQRKLFSYVDIDNYALSENDLNAVECGKGYISFLANKMNLLDISSGSNVRNFKNISKKKIINYSPSDDFRKQRHFMTKNVEKMYIMVDLGSKYKDEEMKKRDENVSHEYILCVLTYDVVNRMLEMTPSFSQSEDRPYCIGVDRRDTRSAYHYWLHHVSLDISTRNLIEEQKLTNRILQHQKELRELQIGTDFAIVKANHIYLTILGEIVSARDFEYDYLSVHYFVKLPPGWACENIDSLSGATQTAKCNSHGIAHFSYLFQMELVFDLRTLQDSSLDFPELYFEIVSFDKWKRYRNEGYTFMSLPKAAGVDEFDLPCWKAVSKTIRSKLERFFIGGGPEIEDVSYVGIPNDHKNGVMSRFGFETIPSGEIKIKLNMIHQTEILKMEETEKGDLERNELERLDASTLLGSVNSVLEAFRKAREKMIEAKEGLHPKN